MVIVNKKPSIVNISPLLRILSHESVSDNYFWFKKGFLLSCQVASLSSNRFSISRDTQMATYFRTTKNTIGFITLPAGRGIINFPYFDNELDNSFEEEITLNGAIIQGINEQFKIVSEFFRFNKTEWADIFGVSRVTIYSWLKNETEPQYDNSRKISTIFTILNSVSDHKEDGSISRNYLIYKINKYYKSLLEIFREPTDSIQKYPDLPNVLNTLMNKTKSNNARINRLADDDKERERNLSYNLRKLSH